MGKSSISADVRDGSRRDAIEFALGVNSKHGLRRTQADKRKAITCVLQDPEWSKLSDREIGRRCGADHKTVGSIRRELTSGEIPARTGPTKPRGETLKPTSEVAAGGSMVARLLAKAETAALVAECRRRGLEVVGHED